MKGNLKKTHSLKRARFNKKIVVLMIFIFASLLAAFGGVASSFNSGGQPLAYAVEEGTGKTDLGTGGLTVGTNNVRASQADFTHGSTPGSRSDYRTKGNTQSGVLSIGSTSTTMGFFAPGVKSSGMHFTSKIRPSTTLRSYISDPAIKVTARALVDIYLQDYVSHDADSSDFCNISLVWHPSNSVTSTSTTVSKADSSGGINPNVAIGSLNTFELTASGLNADAYLELTFNAFGANTVVTHQEGGLWGIGETTVYDSGVGLKLANIRIEIQVNLVSPSMTPNSTYEIIGDQYRMPDCEYIKTNDYIIIHNNLRASNNPLTDTSLANVRQIYGIPSNEGVVAWKEGKPTGEGPYPDIQGYFESGVSYLIRENPPGTPGNSTDYNNGKTAKFLVRAGVPTGDDVLIMSYLPVAGFNVHSSPLTIKVDNALPNAPELAPSTTFMQTVNANKYFNSDLIFSTDENFFTVDALAQQGGAKEYIYYTTNGADPLPGTEYTHILRGYDANGQLEYHPLDFSGFTTMPQDNIPLKIRTFDGVGNRSSIVQYTVRLDTNDYLITTRFGLGDYLAYTSEQKVQAFSKLQFSESYDPVSGAPIFAPSGATNLDNYTYKREDKVTIRIEQNAIQHNNYKINYIVGGDWATANYNITMTQSGSVYRYDMVFYIASATRTDIRIYFKKKAEVVVNTRSREYTGSPLLASGVVITAYNQDGDRDYNVNFNIKVKQEDEPSSAYSSEGFVNAGTYNYLCEIESNKYFGSTEGTYTITKKSSDVRGITMTNLIYGAGMDQASIMSLGPDSKLSETISFGGVEGTFTIESPSPFSEIFQLPGVGDHNVLVKFTPKDAENADPYDPRYNYGACKLNYKEHTEYVRITVSHQVVDVTFDESTFNAVFCGEPLSVIANTPQTPEPQPLAIEYKLVGQPDASYTVQPPTNAGTYEVRATIMQHASNYKGEICTEGTELKFFIDKRDIDVVIGQNGQQIAGLECYYGHFSKPSQAMGLKAGLYLDELDIFDEGIQEIVPVLFDFEISLAEANEFAPLPTEYQMISSGSYDLKIIVNSNNNRGSVTYPLLIRKGTESYGLPGSNFTINFPGIEVDFFTGGNIIYGQRLSDLRFSKGDAYRASYKVFNRTIILSGRFEVFENIADPVLPAGVYSDRQLQFIPDDSTNFGIVAVTVQIIVAKATPNYSEITMLPIVFGQKVGESEHQGDAYFMSQGVKTIVEGTLEVIGEEVVPNAGTMNILHSFVPEDTDNFCSTESLYIPLTINKADAIITFAKAVEEDEDGNLIIKDIRTYGDNFSSPVVTTEPEGLNVEFTYIYENNVVNITAQSPVGIYYVHAEIVDNNYKGTFENILEIKPAELALAVNPVNSLLRYGMYLNEVTLTGGSCTAKGRSITGTFTFDYPDTLAADVGPINFLATFIADPNLYGSNYLPLEVNLTINVQKAETQIVIVEDSFASVYNEQEQAPQASAEDAEGNSLQIVYTFTKNGETFNNTVTEAGDYQVTVTVNDEYYTASLTRSFVIEKAEATILVNEQDKATQYTGEAQSVQATTDKDKPEQALSITQSFRDYRGVAVDDAKGVGLYSATLTINDNNYYGQLQIPFTIKEESYEFGNLEQVYGSVTPVTFETQPADLTWSLLYKGEEASDSTYSTTLPLIAGSYIVKAVFDHNGYTGFYEQGFEIEKAEAEITCDEEVSREYINRVRTMPASTTPTNLTLVYEFSDGEVDEEGELIYSTIQPLSVGTYSMRITINDVNYKKTKIVTYIITPAGLEIIDSPFVNAIAYKDTNGDVVFMGGKIVFIPNVSNPVSLVVHDGINAILGGEYSIPDTSDSIEGVNVSALSAGVYRVQYKFSPDDSNYKPVYGYLSLTIQKKDISEYIKFNQDDLEQSYNSRNLSVRAYIDNEQIAGEVAAIDMLYNGIKLSPTNVGEYVLTAIVVDPNYQGSVTTNGTNNFKIIRGVPQIVNPILTSINVGQKLSESSISLGYAFIEGTELRIPGVFSFENPNMVMNAANMRNVTLRFTPDATNNFQYITFTMQIKVIGQQPTLVSKAATTITYGAPLSESNLDIQYNVAGNAVWVNPDYVPKVGDVVDYRFIPTAYDVYNMVEGSININVEKADISVSNAKGIAFVGNTFNSATITGNFSNTLYPLANVEGVLQLISVEGYNVNDNISTNLTNVKGVVKFTSPNYNEKEFEVLINTYYLISDDNIQIRQTIKDYDGQPLHFNDFNISITEISHSIYPEQYSFVFEKDGQVIEQADTADVAMYMVELTINDPVYYGVKRFSYMVKKINLSAYINMEGLTTTFDNVVAPTVNFGSYSLSPEEYQITYKMPEGTTYNAALPESAGIYDAKVAINSAIYEGVMIFEFKIEKADISTSIRCDNMTQNYGQVNPPMPTFGATNVGEDSYAITYDGSLLKPEDAGEYTATITINHKNYTGTKDISFKINKATIAVKDHPALSEIRYGQGLVDIIISGGSVLHDDIIAIPGSFKIVSVISSSGNLVVGDNAVLVRFTPVNANYITLEFPLVVTVQKAIASIDFRNLELEYDGHEQTPQFIITPDSSIRANVSYYHDGILLTSAPINAGTYTIRATINDINYEGSRSSVFIIKKAKAKEVVLPTASELIYMEAVKNVNFSGGSMSYISGQGSVNGIYKFVHEGTILGDAGKTYDVPFIFQPIDSANYDIYEGLIQVTVVKKEAIIIIENNVFTYGSTLAGLTIKTSPAGLSVSHNIPDINQIYDAGSYTYNAAINDNNYKGKLKFSVNIVKKAVSLVFYKNNDRTNIVYSSYDTVYSVPLPAQAYVQGLLGKDLALENSINNRIIYEYYSKNKTISYGHTPPGNAGEYIVVARLSHNNYYVGESSSEILYNIARAEVEDIIFDSRTLSSQIYGDVQAPIITTYPHDIKLEISYVGYPSKMPTNAGFYTIKAKAVDPNYLAKEKIATFRILPRTINITNIKVENKVFSNTSNLVISGNLTGVLIGDEVSVQMTARCKDGRTNVGYHDVEILTYTLIGRHADNYATNAPVYREQAYIADNKVMDEATKAYMTSSKGFNENVMIKVTTIDSVNTRGGIVSTFTGQESTVQSFTVMEGDKELMLSDMIKVYIKIPDKYLDAENLEFIALGNLAYANVTFDREGDYVTFYTNTTGEVMFVNSKAPTTAILFVCAGAVLVLGVLFIFFTNPVRKRKRVTAERYRYMR